MQCSTGNKAKLTATIVLVLLMASVSLMANVTVQAQETAHGGQPTVGYEGPTTIPAGQTADYTMQPEAFLSVSPNPIGVGQELLVNVWTTFPAGEGKYQIGYTVTITKPDGTKDTISLKSYVADGTSWFTYIPTQVGEWKFQFSFAGEWFPAGYYLNGQYSATRTGIFANAIYNPSDYVKPATSPVTTLTVQSEMVISWHSALPTDYWTRPIEPNNREWNVIAGNYPWEELIGGANSWSDRYYGPFVTAPNTAHIVWKRQGALAGIIGGETGVYATQAFIGTPSVIYMGRCYQTVTKIMTVLINGTYRQQPTSVAECYDLRTGQIYYDIPTADGGITPTHISYWKGVDLAVPGAGEAATYGVELHTISGSRLYKINPWTGAISVNVSLPSGLGTAEMFYRNGYYLSYRVNSTDYMTTANITVARSTTGFLVNWTEQGSSTNFTSRIVSNITVTIPNSLRTVYQTGAYGALGAYDPDTGITIIQDRFIYGGYYGSNYWAVNLLTGQMLWNISTPVTKMESAYRPTNAWCRHGIYVAEMELGYWQARDEYSGKILWETEMNDYPWGEFWMYDLAAYENLILGCGYTGVWALDEKTGKVVWHYADPAVPFETPYNSNITTAGYAVQTIRIADGKVYVANSEHTPTQPATRGWGMFCLNVTTGEFLWKISGSALSPGAAADGYLTAASSYDGYMYVLGKGKSATTVTATPTVSTQGSALMIQGTVLDQSPSQPGTPCVSKESMAGWMDYLHMQMPIPATVTGVPISIDAIDPNGNAVHIATVTSDMSGTFKKMWTPEITGEYTVTATFMGDDSYGSSYAETAVGVTAAPAATPTPTPPAVQAAPDTTPYIIGMGIAIIIAVAIVGIMLYRKRP
jgi:hypothetical protein